jgi:hypothetical protein
MKIIAVDPGLSGAICVLDIDSLAADFYDLPTVQFISAIGRKYRRIDDEQLRSQIRMLAGPHVAFFIVEVQSGYGPIPGSTKFVLGDVFGLLRGLILSTNLSLETVKSQVWKRGFGLHKDDDMSVGEFKNLSRLTQGN